MINGYIQLSRVLELMEQLDSDNKPLRFQMKFVTADRNNKRGGEIIEVLDARKCIGHRKDNLVFDTRAKAPANSATPKNPNHWANSTRNIFLANGSIRKIHIRLIIEFNHQKVFF